MAHELTPKQITAMRRGIILGRVLQKDHPEIVEMYKRGYTLSKIIDELNIQLNYRVSDRVSRSSVHYAIAGYDGGFEIEAYEGLVNREERKRIRREHIIENNRKSYEKKIGMYALTSEEKREARSKGGCETFKKRKGIHAQTLEERRKTSSKGGLIGGHKLYNDGRGIHAQTLEEIREASQKGVIARGRTPWTYEEKEFAYQLSLNLVYQKGSLVNNKLIATELNNKFHCCERVRTAISVHRMLFRYKKSLEAKVN